MPEEKITVDGQPFLGRTEEQERFREALRIIQIEKRIISKVIDWATEKKPPQPFVFLLYGEGGMGKTSLTKRLLDIVENESQFKGDFNALWLDWEKRRDLDYALKVRDAITPEKVFEHIYILFRDNNYGREFTEYEKTIIARSKTEKKVSDALEKITDRGERFKVLRELGGKGIAWLIRSGIATNGVPIPVPAEPTEKIFTEIIKQGAESIEYVRETATIFLKTALEERDFDLFTLPNEKLAHSLAEGIRRSASERPLLLFLDTYEIPDAVDIWVREIIKRSGPNLLWVISGRDNLADSRKLGTRYLSGYRGDFSSDRLRVFPLSEFSVDEVFNYLVEYVPDRYLTINDAIAIHKATLGIPFAVQAAAYMWKSGTMLESIAGNIPEAEKRDEIVKLMTERFLLHCFDDPAHPNDLQNIYALALAYQPEPKLLSTMLHSSDLEQDLSELEQRHSFVFLNKMKLHSSVQAFLREYLLHRLRRNSSKIEVIQKRAIDYLSTACSERESRFSTLDKAIEDDLWKEAKLGLIHHTFWVSSDNGWVVFLPAFVAGLMYDRSFAHACLEIIISVFDTLRAPEKTRFDIIKKGLSNLAHQENIYLMLDRLEKLNQLQSNDKFVKEISACISLLQGQSLFARDQYNNALIKFEDTEKKLADNNDRVREELGYSLYLLGDALSKANPPLENIWFGSKIWGIIDKAINWMSDKHKGYASLGWSLSIVLRYDEAIQAFKKSIALNDSYENAYYLMGLVYRNQRNIEAAIEYCLKAVNINPNFFAAHNGLGYLYNQSGEFELADRHLEKAIEERDLPHPFVNLGITKLLLGHTEDAMSLFEKANEIAVGEKYIGIKGWTSVIMGDIQTGIRYMTDALKRREYILDVQNIYDWTMLLAKTPNPLPEVEILLEFIRNESAFKKVAP